MLKLREIYLGISPLHLLVALGLVVLEIVMHKFYSYLSYCLVYISLVKA